MISLNSLEQSARIINLKINNQPFPLIQRGEAKWDLDSGIGFKTHHSTSNECLSILGVIVLSGNKIG